MTLIDISRWFPSHDNLDDAFCSRYGSITLRVSQGKWKYIQISFFFLSFFFCGIFYADLDTEKFIHVVRNLDIFIYNLTMFFSLKSTLSPFYPKIVITYNVILLTEKEYAFPRNYNY